MVQAPYLHQRCKKKLTEKVTWYKNKKKREDDAPNNPEKKGRERCMEKISNILETPGKLTCRILARMRCRYRKARRRK